MKPRIFFGLCAFVTSVGTASAGTLTFTVAGASNPFLAGMPDGSTALLDTAPAQSPVKVTGFALNAGDILTFAATGSVRYDQVSAATESGPDGGSLFTTQGGGANGIAGVTAPLNALLGVFLDDTQPSLTPAPASLNFTTAASRDFTSLSPLLKQAFFIGDGLTSGSVSQEFVVPTGATRFFVGTHDGFGWFNNSGSFTVSVTGPLAPTNPGVPAIPLPAAGWLLLAGLGALGAMARRRTA